MPGKFLCHFKISGSAQNCSYKVMPERVGGDRTNCFYANRFLYTLVDDIPACGGGNGLDFITRAFIVAGKEGQGASGRPEPIQHRPGTQVILVHPWSEWKTGLQPVCHLADNDGFTFIPVDIAAARPQASWTLSPVSPT
jgi:hypothetical protein